MIEQICVHIPTRSDVLVYIKTALRKRRSVLKWPAKGSDLDPVEMFWSILDKKLAAKPIYSIIELRQRLEEE